jgi:hypothetical protein
MKPGLSFVSLVAICCVAALFNPFSARADDWRSKYSTGRYGELFEACCGIRDCRTAEQLGYPKMKRDSDGSYDVKIGKYWVRYDFPAVHKSEDAKTWICYMETGVDPEPLCLFLPPGVG